MTTTEAGHWPDARQHAGYSRMGIPPECPACPKPEAPCPPSDTVILDLPWFEVQLGDLVLYAGAWTRLDAMWPATDDSQWLGISVFYAGSATNHQVRAHDLVAVKRYITEG